MPSSSRGHRVRCARPTWRRCARPDCRRRRSLRRPLSPPTSITPIVWRRGWGSSPRVDRSLRPPLARRYTVGQPTQAGMAELADAKVSKTFERKLVGVRSPLPARTLLLGCYEVLGRGPRDERPEGHLAAEGVGALLAVRLERQAAHEELTEYLPGEHGRGLEEGLPLPEPGVKLGLELGGVEPG